MAAGRNAEKSLILLLLGLVFLFRLVFSRLFKSIGVKHVLGGCSRDESAIFCVTVFRHNINLESNFEMKSSKWKCDENVK